MLGHPGFAADIINVPNKIKRFYFFLDPVVRFKILVSRLKSLLNFNYRIFFF